MALVIGILGLLALAGAPAADQLERSALSGDREAAFMLGRAYKLGDSVPLDTNKAARWLEKAAHLGHTKAGAELGLVLFQDGKGQEALPWLRTAAERGDARAQYALGTIYFAGKLVPADPAQARLWMGRAARSRLPAAIEALAIMSKPLTLEVPRDRNYAVVTIMPERAKAVVAEPRRSNWQVQLGAFSVAGNAQRMWRSIRPDAPAPLKASFPKDGTLTRLRIAPFESRADAERFCALQRRRNRDCLEVRGGG